MRNILSYDEFLDESLIGSVAKGAGIGMGAGMVARGGKHMYDNYKKNKETGGNDSLVKGIGKEIRKGAGEGAFVGAAAGGVGHYGKKRINTIKSKFKKDA